MPSSTPNYALPYPLTTDANNPPSDFAALATAVDTTIKAQGTRPMFLAVLTANFTMGNNAFSNVPWGAGTEIIDELSWHDTVTNNTRVKPTLPGRYFCSFIPTFAANATSERRSYIAKNGTSSHNFARGQAQGANSMTLAVSGLVVMNGTTDYVEAAAFQLSGGSLDLLGAGDAPFSTSFEMIYLGNL